MSEKRFVVLKSIDEAIAEIDRLRKGYRKTGNWSLPMTARHMVLTIRPLLATGSGRAGHARPGRAQGKLRRRAADDPTSAAGVDAATGHHSHD